MSQQEKSASTATRRGRLPASAKQERRREVLAVALDLIVSDGYPGLTMQALAARAGASKETLYAWFGDRDAVVAALIADNADRSAAALVDAVSATPTSRAEADRVLVRYAEALLDLLTSDISVALNRAAMSSPGLAASLLAGGRHRAGATAAELFVHLHEAGWVTEPDGHQAFRTFFGLVVSDTQIRVLLGENAPTRAEMVGLARRGVDDFWQVAGTGR